MEHYGSNIERMRIMKGVEQTDIAGELGITQQAWSKLAKQPLIQEEMLEKILKKMNTTKEEFEQMEEGRFINSNSYNNGDNSYSVVNLTINGVDQS